MATINKDKQSNLEKKGFERREILMARTDYNKNDGYGPEHETAQSNPDREFKPQLGKGTGHPGHTHSVPDASRTGIDYSNFDTQNGGGKFDIYGRNNVGGRIRNMTINIYGKENPYGPESVDTSANVAEGQYVVKDL